MSKVTSNASQIFVGCGMRKAEDIPGTEIAFKFLFKFFPPQTFPILSWQNSSSPKPSPLPRNLFNSVPSEKKTIILELPISSPPLTTEPARPALPHTL